MLREAGLVGLRHEARRRVDERLVDDRAPWPHRLDALHTEIARGKKAHR